MSLMQWQQSVRDLGPSSSLAVSVLCNLVSSLDLSDFVFPSQEGWACWDLGPPGPDISVILFQGKGWWEQR